MHAIATLFLLLSYALLSYLSLPPADLDFLAWIAAAPYMAFVLLGGGLRRFPLWAWFGGWLFFALGFSWVGHVSWLVVVLLAAYQGVFPLLYALVQRRVAPRPGWRFFLAAPLLWTGAEHFRGIAFGGFPWLHPGHTQHAHLPLLQLVELTGIAGLNVLVYAVNALFAWLFVAVIRREGASCLRSRAFLCCAGSALIALGATLLFGRYALSLAAPRPGPVCALVQGNIPQNVKEEGLNLEELLQKHVDLSLGIQEPYDVLVWAETMYPYALGRYAENALDAQTLAMRLRKPFVLGAITLEKDARGVERTYNSAYLLSPLGRLVSRYDKVHRVPIGEFIPLRERFSWLDWVVTHASELTSVPNLSAGNSIHPFECEGRRFGVLICGEVMHTYLARSLAQAGCEYLVTLANDGWFKDSGELDQDLHLAAFRCAELKMGMARATNTGISAIIGPRGEIHPLLGPRGETREFDGVLVGQVLLKERETFFERHGDWLGQCCMALLAAGFVYGLARRRSGPPPPVPLSGPPRPKSR
ncbi:MAG: apolipoprotein N-acyltransferase [Planctomycetes bacterium]|nr:apolipoprotein N-acyltransferase [Planctomycetota bacterium]